MGEANPFFLFLLSVMFGESRRNCFGRLSGAKKSLDNILLQITWTDLNFRGS